MKLKRKILGRIVIGSFLATVIIRILTVASVFGSNAYNCPMNAVNCGPVGADRTKLIVGITLQLICWTIFSISLAIYIWYKFGHKE